MLIIFDLDGTIADTKKGVLDSILHATKGHMLNSLDRVDETIIGPPLRDLIEKTVCLKTENEYLEIESKFKTHYDSIGCFKYTLYNDMKKVIRTLKNTHQLIIATNKRRAPTEKILKDACIYDFFEKIYCIDDHKKKYYNKKGMIEFILRNEFEKNDAIYIGDTYEDYIATSANGIKFLAASWGYGLDGLKSIGSEILLRHPNEILTNKELNLL
jgi:phosphoglycolate phosphatase